MEKTKEEIREEQKTAVLEWLPKTRYHIANACKKVGIHRNTFSNWVRNDKAFKDRYKAVKEQKMDDAEERLYLVAYGIPKIDDSGKLIGWEEKPSVRALEVMLKAQAKDRGYGDHLTIDDQREDDDPRDMSSEDMIKKMEEIRKRSGIDE